MKYLQKLRLLTLILLGLLIYSCQNEENFTSKTEEQINLNEQDGLKKMVLGKKLENPYSVENMRKALKNLQKSSSTAGKGLRDDFEITTTHLYIRFKPKDEEELTLLQKDTTLILFDHPMDYEISEEGDFFQDPEIPDEVPTYQYTSIEVGKELPNVDYELLANLYIPYDENEDNDIEDDTTSSKSNSLSMSNIAGLLEDEALKITNNFEKEEKSTISERCWFCRPSKWQPKGKITIWDTNARKYVGVEGIKVRAGRWFKWRRTFTNTKGEYSFAARFRRKVRYKMDWERYHFALRSGFWASAQKRGPYRKGDWNWQIRNGDRHQYYGTIFRAAYHYYYKNIKGLRRPPKNSFWKSQLRIRASRKNAGKLGSHSGVRRVWGLGDQIYIYTFGKPSVDTYATTIHELAHASHWNMNRVNFKNVNAKVKESWARGVQWELTRMVYPKYKGRRWDSRYIDYTLVVADLIDGIGEGNTNYGFNNFKDQVSGFTISQIEYSLKYAQSWNQWREKLISIKGGYDYNNNITRLFKAYE